MPFVIAEPCIDAIDQACISVCPVACIHCDAGKDRKLYIDPDACIDCGACEPICPVEAIYPEFELPAKWRSMQTSMRSGIATKMRPAPGWRP